MASARPPTSDREYPPIPNFGAVKPLRSAEAQPEPDLACKVAFGQALAEQALIPRWVAPDVKIAGAALTALTNYHLCGYAVVPS